MPGKRRARPAEMLGTGDNAGNTCTREDRPHAYEKINSSLTETANQNPAVPSPAPNQVASWIKNYQQALLRFRLSNPSTSCSSALSPSSRVGLLRSPPRPTRLWTVYHPPKPVSDVQHKTSKTSRQASKTSRQASMTSTLASKTSKQAPQTSTQLPLTSTKPPLTSTKPPLTSTQPSQTSKQVSKTSKQAPQTSTQLPLPSNKPPLTSTKPPLTSTQPSQTSKQVSKTSTQASHSSTKSSLRPIQPSLTQTQPPLTPTSPPLTPRCEGCDLKTAENTALQMNVNMWRDRALAAEDKLRILKAKTPARPSSETSKPLRGIQIPKCNYVLLNAKDSIPPGYQLLAEGTRLAVPSTWYAYVMGKTCHSSTAFRLKKIMDGFFSPEDIGCKSAAQFKRNNEAVLQAIEVFGITTLHLLPSQFSDQLSKKICSWRKAYRNLGSQNVYCRSEGVLGLLR